MRCVRELSHTPCVRLLSLTAQLFGFILPNYARSLASTQALQDKSSPGRLPWKQDTTPRPVFSRQTKRASAEGSTEVKAHMRRLSPQNVLVAEDHDSTHENGLAQTATDFDVMLQESSRFNQSAEYRLREREKEVGREVH